MPPHQTTGPGNTANPLEREMEAALIPDKTIISDLIEELRVEQTSFAIFRGDNIPRAGRSKANELVGFFFLEGEMRLSFEKEKPVEARKTDYVLIGRDTGYTLQPLSKAGACAIGRVAFTLGNCPARLLFRLVPKVLYIRGMAEREIAWHARLGELVSNQPPSAQAVSASINRRLIESSLIGLIQTWLHREPSLADRFNGPEIAWIYPGLHAMHQSPESAWSVTALAELCGMSRSSFAAKFSNATGEAPARYLSILRLDKGRDLVRSSNLPLSVIAQHSGYSSDMAFIRAFKRHYGVTPGQMRAGKHSARVGETGAID